MWWNHKRSFKKNHRNCLPPRPGVCSRQKPVRLLHNPPLKSNEYLLHVVNRLPPWSSLGEQFLWFSKNNLLRFHQIFSLLTEVNFLNIFIMFSLRSFNAYLCPNMIHFDALDFSERRSKEVMFLLMLSIVVNRNHFFLTLRASSAQRT